MNNSSTVEWLSTAIEQATKSTMYCVVGCMPAVDPGMDVEGLGGVRLPLSRRTAKDLVALCRVAPYGKGSQTLVNKQVRNTFELDPKKFRLSDAWISAIAGVTRLVAEQLGLPAEQMEARLYKLLVYEKGGFFLPHRDSEKHDRMVASMIVVLPNPFEGGTLIVRHGAAKQKVTFDEAAAGTAPCYAAFYSDCEHEVQRVTSGVRLCLAYNLALAPKRAKRSAGAATTAPVDALAGSIASWAAKQPATPLVFALEHLYTQRGLSLDLLKGVDRQLADQVERAAEQANCNVHLAQVTRHLLQFADDGSLGYGYSRYQPRPKRGFEIGETYEDDLSGTQWTDVRGRKQPWGEIAFDPSAVVSSTPIDDWKATSEEFEGYTGNAGNTLDRWYHRSAIVVWRRDHHFEVVARSGAAECIPLFCSMTRKLAKIPSKRLESARIDCIRFARAIIARWPRRVGYGRPESAEKLLHDAFSECLLTLNDRDTIAAFLSTLAEYDQTCRLSGFVVAACRSFGWGAFAQELKQLIVPRPGKRDGEDLALRDAEWLADFCCDKAAEPAKTALAHELCALATERFCKPRPPQPNYYSPHYRREMSIAELSLPYLLKALAATGRDDDLSRVICLVQELPDEFRVDNSQIPCLKSLIPWSQSRFGSVHPQLLGWLNSVRQKLETATAARPALPTDWARPADVACACKYCAQLKAFLADAANEVGRIPAREDIRRHLIGIMDRHQCDVKHALERKGSPFSLVLTKTNGSFDRAVKRFEADQKLLAALPKL